MHELRRPFFEEEGWITPDHFVSFAGTKTKESGAYRSVYDHWSHYKWTPERELCGMTHWIETIEYVYPLTRLGNVKTVVDE